MRIIGFGGQQVPARWTWVVLAVGGKVWITAALVAPGYQGPPVLGMDALRQFKAVRFE